MEVCHTASYEALAEREKIVKNAEMSFRTLPTSCRTHVSRSSPCRRAHRALPIAGGEMGEACAAAARLLCQLPEEAARCSPTTSRPSTATRCCRCSTATRRARAPPPSTRSRSSPPRWRRIARLTPRLADDSAPVRKAARRAASAVVRRHQRGDRDELARVADALELFHGGGDDGGDKKTRQRWKAAHSFAEAALQQLLRAAARRRRSTEAGGSVLYRAARDEFAEASGAPASAAVAAAPPAVRRGASVKGAGLPHVAQQLGALEERMVRIWHRRLAEQTRSRARPTTACWRRAACARCEGN